MRIGILKTGHPPAELAAQVPSYAGMIRAALGPRYADHEFDVRVGELPDDKADLDAYVITGSQSGVHDPDPWIASLRDWLNDLNPATPLVGICFGHQLMAQAYGGAVETSAKGWAHGLHEYAVRARKSWMDGAGTVVLPVSHRDQVTEVPRTVQVIAHSEFCPNAVLAYTDRRALSFQAHPEFSAHYAAMLIELRQRKGVIGPEQAELARTSLKLRDDCARVREWIRRFVQAAQE